MSGETVQLGACHKADVLRHVGVCVCECVLHGPIQASDVVNAISTHTPTSLSLSSSLHPYSLLNTHTHTHTGHCDLGLAVNRAYQPPVIMWYLPRHARKRTHTHTL